MTLDSNSPTKLRVFLCHSSNDKVAVRSLYTKLRKDGFEPWLDEEDIDPGQNWEIEIPRAVRKSHVVIVCLSKGSINQAGYVQKEIKFALDKADELPEDTIYIIPLRLEECEVPERLRAWQWVNYFNNNGYERLKKSLASRAKSLELNLDLPNRETLSINTSPVKSSPLKALIMKGGGVKGLAYVGALKVLEKYYSFDWFVGTSAGAIAAALLAAGYSAAELEEILSNKNFLNFLDNKWMAPINLIFYRGFFKARTFTTWIDELLSQKIKSFGPLPLSKLPKRVTVYASRRNERALIFDSEDERKETAASFAVRCSM